MRRFVPLAAATFTALVAIACGIARAQETGAPEATSADTKPAETKPADERFLRLQYEPAVSAAAKQASLPVALQTSIVRYAGAAQHPDLIVDLVGAIHIADPDYYDRLNEQFPTYDVVLFEMVAPKDAVPLPGQRSAHPVSMMQTGMKEVLNLEFQLDGVDYQAKNFVHADMTPEEFAQSMKQRGESLGQMFLRMFGQSVAMQSKDPLGTSDARLLAALFSKNRAREMKRVLAKQFANLGDATAALDGPDGSTILTERNKAAFRVLAEQIAAGRRKIAIFYGAAHLPDMEVRLREIYGLSATETTWLTAWKL